MKKLSIVLGVCVLAFGLGITEVKAQTKKQKEETEAVVKTYNTDGQLISETTYSDVSKQIKHGVCREYYPDGQLKSERYYVNGMLHGPLRSFYPNGQLKRKDEFAMGKLKSGACFDEQGRAMAYTDYYVEAQFPGGLTSLMQTIVKEFKYPEQARQQDIEGEVYVSFIINEDGQVMNAKIAQSAHPLLNEEALRLIENLPDWDPAQVEGQGTAVAYTLPINFKIR